MRLFRVAKLLDDNARNVPPKVTVSGITLNASPPLNVVTVTTCSRKQTGQKTFKLLPRKFEGFEGFKGFKEFKGFVQLDRFDRFDSWEGFEEFERMARNT